MSTTLVGEGEGGKSPAIAQLGGPQEVGPPSCDGGERMGVSDDGHPSATFRNPPKETGAGGRLPGSVHPCQ